MPKYTHHSRAREGGALMIEVTEMKTGKKIIHRLDTSQVDSLDEISGDEQLALVWCETHQTWEWHWLERSELGGY
jgi:hypothetical protein